MSKTRNCFSREEFSVTKAIWLAPMAVSISAGLGIATLLVLFVVPALYLAFEDVRGLGLRILGRSPAAVPADEASPTPPESGDDCNCLRSAP